MVDKLRVGVITSVHGLSGEVKVYPTTDSPDRYDTLSDVILVCRGMERELKIVSRRYFKQFVIVRFADLHRIEDVQGFVKGELYVTRENALPLEEGEYYIADLQGLTVMDDEGSYLGILQDVLQTGANDVYIVRNGDKEILLPVIESCIKSVDLEKGVVTAHILPGLID